MTLKTPAYGLEYLAQGEPARATRLALERNAKTIEAALLSQALPPAGATDLAALAARVNLIETAPVGRWSCNRGFSLPYEAFTAIPWHVEDFDTAGMVTPGQTIVKCMRAGYYQLQGGVSLGNAVAGRTVVQVQSSTGRMLAGGGGPNGQAADGQQPFSAVCWLDLAETFQVIAYQGSGSGGTAQGTSDAPWGPTYLSLAWLRP